MAAPTEGEARMAGSAGPGRPARGAGRVKITYETSEGGRRQRKELPFVLGVVGDFSAKAERRVPLRERKFGQVDRTNFDTVMAVMRPRLAFLVQNKLRGDDSQLAVELSFRSLEDFGPQAVALQVPPLRQLVDLRQELAVLLRRIYDSPGRHVKGAPSHGSGRDQRR
jgi:type VI secretion system protein ImpB